MYPVAFDEFLDDVTGSQVGRIPRRERGQHVVERVGERSGATVRDHHVADARAHYVCGFGVDQGPLVFDDLGRRRLGTDVEHELDEEVAVLHCRYAFGVVGQQRLAHAVRGHGDNYVDVGAGLVCAQGGR